MSRPTNLITQDLVLIHTILEVRATDLENYIRDTDYVAKYGTEQAEAVSRADANYLADIRTAQAKVNDTI
jgi:hypothetical protein